MYPLLSLCPYGAGNISIYSSIQTTQPTYKERLHDESQHHSVHLLFHVYIFHSLTHSLALPSFIHIIKLAGDTVLRQLGRHNTDKL